MKILSKIKLITSVLCFFLISSQMSANLFPWWKDNTMYTWPSPPTYPNCSVTTLTGTLSTSIYIPKGYIVDVTGTLFVANDAKIVVGAGAILRIKNATITNVNDFTGTSTSNTNFWYGIVVLGDNTKSQNKELDYVCNKMDKCFNPPLGIVNYCCFNHDQGVVYMENAKIRNSYVGISVGDASFSETIGPSYGTEPYPWYGGQSGGLIYIRSSRFENNFETAITFAPYNKFQQLSVIQGNYFSSRFTNGGPFSKTFNNYYYSSHSSNWKGTINTTFIKVSQNNFKNHIKNNQFYYTPTTGYNPNYQFTGISSFSSTFVASGNYFGSLEFGFLDNSGIPRLKRKPIIKSNNFSYCLIGIKNVSSDAVTMKNNTFSIPSGVPGKSAIGIFTSNADLTEVSSNLFYRANQYTKDNWGIDFYGTGWLANTVRSNTFQNLQYGFHSEGDNRFTQLSCNTFSGIKAKDINIYNSPGIATQGAPSKSAGNLFSSMPGGGVSQWNIQNNATGALKYYYQSTPGSHNPQYTINVSKSLATANSCEAYYSTPDYEASICAGTPGGTGGIVVIGGFIWDHYIVVEQRKEDIENGGVSEGEEAEYSLTLQEYDLTLTDLVYTYSEIMLADSLPDSTYNDTIINLLQNHQTPTGDILLAQYYLGTDNYTACASLIAAMETEYDGDTKIEEFCTYMTMMLDYAQDDYSTDWLVENFSDLKTIADAGGVMSSKAKLLTQQGADLDSANAYHGTMMYEWIPQDSTADTLSTDTLAINVTIYPNPFQSTVNVEIENTANYSRSFVVSIVNLSATVLDSENQSISANDTETVVLDPGSVSTGFYIIKIEESSTVVYYAWVYKN